jgi:hypothetical protein
VVVVAGSRRCSGRSAASWQWGFCGPGLTMLPCPVGYREGGGGSSLPRGCGAATRPRCFSYVRLGPAAVTTTRWRGWLEDRGDVCWWAEVRWSTSNHPGLVGGRNPCRHVVQQRGDACGRNPCVIMVGCYISIAGRKPISRSYLSGRTKRFELWSCAYRLRAGRNETLS